MKKLKKTVLFILCILCVISTFSCSKNKTKWKSGKGKVAVVFGYGYNDEEFVNNTKEFLSTKFGLADNNGLIVPLVYPDDFPSVGERAKRMLSLASLVEEKNCTALITLGSPEYTHRALAKIQDNELNCYVVSLFSQDDVLGTEAGSEIVIDFAEPEKNPESEIDFNVETSIQHLDKMNFILEKTIKAVSDDAVVAANTVPETLFKMLGNDWQVCSFIDSSTGLKSKNHYVLKYTGKTSSKKKVRKQ